MSRKVKSLYKITEDMTDLEKRDLIERQKRVLTACIRNIADDIRDKDDTEVIFNLDIIDPKYSRFIESAPLGVATCCNSIDAVKKILALGFNPCIEGTAYSPALKIAAINGYDELVGILLDHVADHAFKNHWTKERFEAYCAEHLERNPSKKYENIAWSKYDMESICDRHIPAPLTTNPKTQIAANYHTI